MAVGKSGIPLIEIRGAIGNVVFQRHGNELSVRARTVPSDPKTPLQQASRARLQQAAATWKSLTQAEFEAWKSFSPNRTYTTFSALATRWLALHGTGTPPKLPPSGPFLGDNVQVSLVAEVPVPPQGGTFEVQADQANAPGVVTEIVVQALPNRRYRTYPTRWITAGFVTFAPGALRQSLPFPPGFLGPAFVVGYRFVRAATGQSTPILAAS